MHSCVANAMQERYNEVPRGWRYAMAYTWCVLALQLLARAAAGLLTWPALPVPFFR